MLPDRLDRLDSRRSLQHGIAARFQQDPADPPDIRLIVHHQNADCFFHGCSLLCGVIISHFRKLSGGIKNF